MGSCERGIKKEAMQMRRINIDDERHKVIAERYGNFKEMRNLSEELV